MKILVAIKRVIDPYVKVRVSSSGIEVDRQRLKMSINPFDEIALEEALRLREQKLASELLVVTIGDDASIESLRQALALGADRAILIKTDSSCDFDFCSLNIAKILYKITLAEQVQLVLMGKQSIDGDNSQTPQMLAALLNWPQATFASKLIVAAEYIEVTREIDGGLEKLKLKLPALVSVDLRLNNPRYASLPNIMKAKSKPLEILELGSLGLELRRHAKLISLENAALKRGGIVVDSVELLIDKLQHEAHVL